MIKENTPFIETERLILRKFKESDIEDILLIYGDIEVNKFLPWFPITDIDQAKNYFFNTIAPNYKKEVAYNYAVVLKSNNRAIGYVNINDIGDSNDIGYGLHKDFWGKGLAVEACTAVCNRFKSAGFLYITATHDINNPNSGSVMKKLGMNYRYSYKEQWQPKDLPVTFRMYQLNFDGNPFTYTKYQNNYTHFIEQEF